MAAAAEEEEEWEVVEEFLVVWRRSEEGLELVDGEEAGDEERAEEEGGGNAQRRVRTWLVFIACPFHVGERGLDYLKKISDKKDIFGGVRIFGWRREVLRRLRSNSFFFSGLR